jgi:hypothetical protein
MYACMPCIPWNLTRYGPSAAWRTKWSNVLPSWPLISCCSPHLSKPGTHQHSLCPNRFSNASPRYTVQSAMLLNRYCLVSERIRKGGEVVGSPRDRDVMEIQEALLTRNYCHISTSSSDLCVLSIYFHAFVSDIQIINAHAGSCCSLAVASISCFFRLQINVSDIQTFHRRVLHGARSSRRGVGEGEGVSGALRATTRAPRSRNPGSRGSVSLEDWSSSARAVSASLGVVGFSLALWTGMLRGFLDSSAWAAALEVKTRP